MVIGHASRSPGATTSPGRTERPSPWSFHLVPSMLMRRLPSVGEREYRGTSYSLVGAAIAGAAARTTAAGGSAREASGRRRPRHQPSGWTGM
ncbi:hypothetical protein SAT01_06380 [Sinomonas atrocyanea]|nr:hypothetical protein SAT01_06380 [Sinomonas atrocyanea]